nr:MAG TPA: Single strand binding protein [Caudoviricetes sp.]
MNKLTIIGNLTRDPETRVTQSGASVCSFTVAVNRRGQDDKTDFFRVSAWNKTGETCQKYLAKGRKVAVTGPVSVSTYSGQDGKAYANLEVMAQDVEFLSPKGEQTAPAPAAPNNGYQEVTDDDCPF